MDDIQITRELRADGFERGEIERATRSGELRRLRRGAYTERPDEPDPRIAHLDLLEATVRQSSPELVASGATAAAVHGLPTWRDQLGRVELTRNRAGGRKVRRYSVIRSIPLQDHEMTVVDGFLVTSLPRTVLDLSCSLTMRRSVAVGDAALRRGVSREDLELALAAAPTRHGIARARRAIPFLDARSESAGESESRVVLHEIGIPKPDLQVEVRDRTGRLLGRCDFEWEEFNTVGEFDGLVKYARPLDDDARPPEGVVVDEKLREDAIRGENRQMVRWIYRDLNARRELRAKLQRAFERGGGAVVIDLAPSRIPPLARPTATRVNLGPF